MMKTRHSLRKAVPSTPPVKTTKAVKRPAKESPQKNSSSNSQSPSAPVVPAKTIRHSLRNLEQPEDEKVKEKVKVAPTKPAAEPKDEDEEVEVEPTEPMKKRKAGRPFKIATNTVATPTARQSLRKTKATPEVEQEDEKVEVEPTEPAAEPKDEKVEVAPTEPVKKKKAEKPPILSLELFYQTIRSSGEMSERWVLNEPIYDVSLNSNVIMFNELDVTMDGELRVKRGVKVCNKLNLFRLMANYLLTTF